MLGLAGVGYLRNKRGVVWRLRSLWAKMSLLAVIFALVPLFLYFEFSKAYQDSQDLLLQSVRGQGRVISQSLLPLLKNTDGATLLGLGQQLERFAGQVTTIKLLLDPAGSDDDGFYYIASSPTVVASNLEAERQILARRGFWTSWRRAAMARGVGAAGGATSPINGRSARPTSSCWAARICCSRRTGSSVARSTSRRRRTSSLVRASAISRSQGVAGG